MYAHCNQLFHGARLSLGRSTQEVHRHIWNPKVHKSPLLYPILSQMNPIYTFPSGDFKIQFEPDFLILKKKIKDAYGITLLSVCVSSQFLGL